MVLPFVHATAPLFWQSALSSAGKSFNHPAMGFQPQPRVGTPIGGEAVLFPAFGFRTARGVLSVTAC